MDLLSAFAAVVCVFLVACMIAFVAVWFLFCFTIVFHLLLWDYL